MTGAASSASLSVPTEARPINWSGWINVVIGAVIMVATMPGRTQGLGLITEPMHRDLQIDRVA